MLDDGAERFQEAFDDLNGRGKKPINTAGLIFLRRQAQTCYQILLRDRATIRADIAEQLKEVGFARAAAVSCRIILTTVLDGEIIPYRLLVSRVARALAYDAKLLRLRRSDPNLFAEMQIALGHAPLPTRRRVFNALLKQHDVTTEARNDLALFLLRLFLAQTALVRMIQHCFGFETVTAIEATPQLRHFIMRDNAALIASCPILRPCRIPPRPWIGVEDGGYHHPVIAARRPAVAGASEVFHVEHCADVLDELGRVGFRYEKRTVAAFVGLHDAWAPIAGLSQPLRRFPPKPEGRKRTIQERIEMAAIFRWNTRQGALQIRQSAMRYHLNAMAARNPWHFVWTADFRGRMYASAQRFSPMAGDIVRAACWFENPQPIDTTEAKQAFLVHGANRYGLDKKPLSERIEWARDYQRTALEIAANPLDERLAYTWADAEEPFQFLAWCFALADAAKGKPCRMPVLSDATSNVVQILAALAGDEALCEAANVFPSEKPNDLYGEMAQRAVPDLIDGRQIVKELTIARLYGANDYSNEARVRLWAIDNDVRAYTNYKKIAEKIAAELARTLEPLFRLTEWISSVGAACARKNKALAWSLPDGFLVENRYFSRVEVEDLLTGKVQVRLSPERAVVDPRAVARATTPNFVHSLDAAIARRVIRAMAGSGVHEHITIHDCFGGHARDQATRLAEVRAAFVEILGTNPLEMLRRAAKDCAGVDPGPPPIRNIGGEFLSRARHSPYLVS